MSFSDYLQKMPFLQHAIKRWGQFEVCMKICADNRVPCLPNSTVHLSTSYTRHQQLTPLADAVTMDHCRISHEVVYLSQYPYPAVQQSFNKNILIFSTFPGIDRGFGRLRLLAAVPKNKWSALAWQNNINHFTIIHMRTANTTAAKCHFEFMACETMNGKWGSHQEKRLHSA